MKYWLMKSEPNTYGWENLLSDGETFWDGVRNYQARNCMRDMKVGDLAFFYHSVKERRIMGVAKIIKEAYQDPSTKEEAWVAVDIEPVYEFKKKISLDDIKAHAQLSEMVLVKNSRLSVQPVTELEFALIEEMSNN